MIRLGIPQTYVRGRLVQGATQTEWMGLIGWDVTWDVWDYYYPAYLPDFMRGCAALSHMVTSVPRHLLTQIRVRAERFLENQIHISDLPKYKSYTSYTK